MPYSVLNWKSDAARIGNDQRGVSILMPSSSRHRGRCDREVEAHVVQERLVEMNDDLAPGDRPGVLRGRGACDQE
jgi:hypothetical protein